MDAGALAVAVAFGLTAQQLVIFGGFAHLRTVPVLDLAVGAVALSAVLWLRRPAPVAFTVLGVAASLVSTVAGAVPLIGAFSVAAHRRWPVALATSLLVVLNAGILQIVRYPVPDPPSAALGGVLCAVAATGWGMFARARRRVVALLEEQVAQERRAAGERAERARRDERSRIAREMHDALGHRLSLLAVHGGALAFRTDLPADEVTRVAGIVRDQSRLALTDLRTAVSALREGPQDPPPRLADLPRLVDEACSAGLDVTLRSDDGPEPPPSLGRAAYRIVQEALTNSRRHGAGLPVDVRVEHGDGALHVAVEERGPRAVAPAGTGAGLTGLRERVALLGGTLDAGPGPEGGYRVRATLPL
ncbi:histidine kinase [Pseudonocardia ailaonensis]|uniref:histidine kinase n=1 Tax=Pseudonocardia ailaonensis TaxID=367279 RepID=A0ABN2MWW9_9PSEU